MNTLSCVYYHQWWFFVSWGSGLLLEIIGYAGRIWYHYEPTSRNAYIMELVCVTVAPCFLMAGIYYTFAQLTLIYGQQYSYMKPMHYSLTFIICDLFSIFLQAAGGGVASSAASSGQSTANGAHIMIAGLSTQVATIAVYQFLWYSFLWKVYKDKRDFGDYKFNQKFVHVRSRPYMVYYMVGISVTVLLIFTRSIYRVIEIAAGWNSKIATEEIYFMILEGLMVGLSACIMAIISPGLVYGRNSHLHLDKSLSQKKFSSDTATETEDFNKYYIHEDMHTVLDRNSTT